MLPLALAAPVTHAADYTRAQINSFDWYAADNWSPNGVPGAADRAIFTNITTLSTSSGPISVGQLVFLGTSSGTNGSFAPPVMTIHGVNDVGVDQQATNLSRLWDRITIASDQTWRASNAAGGGFQFAVATGGLVYLDLGTRTLTVDLVNATNVASLNEVRGTGGGIVKTGLGTLTLFSAANTYTGSTVVQAGTVALTGVGTISTSSLVDVASGATFDISGITAASTSISSLAGGGTVVLGSKGLTLTNANHAFGGVIGGTGGLTITGGTQILSGANTYQGGTFLNGAVLSIAANTALGDASGALTFTGGTLQNTAAFTSARAITLTTVGTLRTDADLTVTGPITGGGALFKSGSGVLTLTGASSHTGNTSVSAGELRLESGGTITGTPLTQVNGTNVKLAVRGTGSRLETGRLAVASSFVNVATVNIENGGVVRTTTNNPTQIGGTGASGTVNVTGPGALLDLAGSLTVATNTASASGIVNVTDGGTIHSAGGGLGSLGGATGTKSVTVSGSGSSWTIAGNLAFSNGSLSILGGGAVSAASSTMAHAGSTANLTVSGAGSQYSIAGDLGLGGGAGSTDRTGIITLTDGGRLSVAGQMTFLDNAIARSALNIGGAEAQAAAAPGILDAATLAFTTGTGTGRINFNHTGSDYTFATAVSGGGAINQVAGVTNLTGNSAAFTGPTTVSGGTLRVNGALGDATSTVSVLSGGTLGGAGTIAGAVTVADGGRLAPGNSPGTLTTGALALNAGSILDFELGAANVEGGSLNDLINVNGDLTLDGTLNVTPSAGGTYGAGIYRLINYTGALTDNGLELGLMPAGSVNSVQTSIANQVNLVNTQGLVLGYWDGGANARNNAVIGGGDGIWQAADNDNWTTADGSLNAAHQSGSMAVFSGSPGTVTVDTSQGDIRVAGMQFATDGYRLEGDAITLTSGLNAIRVGDGTAAGEAFTATIASELTGNGTLDKSDLGTLVLTAENTYAGGTTVSAGTLQLGDGGTSGSIDGNVINEGALAFNRSDAVTFGGAISGGGSLNQIGPGSTTLTGANTYTGATTIASGTLALSGTGSIAASSGVVNDGIFDITATDAGASITTLSGSGSVLLGSRALTLTAAGSSFSGLIDGAAGTLNKGGAGTWTLAGTGSEVGTLNVQAGTLELTSGASLASNATSVASGATLRSSGTFTGTAGGDAFSLGGTFAGSASFLDGDDHVQVVEGADVSQAAFDAGGGADTLELIYGSAFALPETLAANFEHLMKRGNGVLTLAGTVDAFGDSITAAEGTVQLSSANVVTNDLRIEQGATVTGTGSLSGSLHNAGIVSPGNSPGTIHVGGDYIQASSGTLISEITRTGTDLLDVSGTATLAGTHQINVEYGLYLDGTTHTLIQAAGGISGQFGSVTLMPSALMTADHQVSTNGESVSFARQATTTITDPNTNQSRYAQWLDEQIAAGGLAPAMVDYIDLLLQQPTAQQAKSLLGEVAEPAGAVTQNSVSTLGASYARAVFDRFALSDGVQCVATQASSDARSCGWMQGLRQWGDADGDRFGAGYDWTTDGAQFGFDRQIEAMTVGVSFGYGDTDLSDAHGARNTLRSKIGALYGSYTAGRLGVDALLLYADHDNRTRRNVVIGTDTQHARAEFDSNSSGIGARIGYRLTSETSPLVRPFAELYYDHIEGAQFTERGARTGNLLVRIHERSGLRGTAGLQWADSYEGFGHVLRPSLEAAIAHQFNDTQSMLDVRSVAGADAFRTYGSQLDRTAYLAKAALEVSLGANALVKVGYSGELADDYSHHQAELGLRIVW